MTDKSRIPKEEIPEAAVSDYLATQESNTFVTGRDLEKEADEAQHGRRERSRGHIAIWTVVGIWSASIIMLYAALVWSLHVFGPPNWRYLSPEELVTVKETLSHLVIGGVIGFLIKNRYL